MVSPEFEETFDKITIRTPIVFICDYCGCRFNRTKKDRSKMNKINSKDSCGAKLCTKAKKQESYVIKFGPDGFQCEEINNKRKKANEIKYGNENYLKTDDFKLKRKNKMVENHGVEHPLRSPEIRKKVEDTCEAVHGVRNYSQHPDFDKNRKVKNLEKYGEISPSMLESVKEKTKETCNIRYNKDYYNQTTFAKEERIRKCIAKNGVSHTSKLPETTTKREKTCKDRYGETNYAKTDEFKIRYVKICMQKFGVPNPFLLRKNQKYGKTQKELQQWLNSFGFNFESNYKILDGKEIDLFDPKLNLAIEYCGLYWHTENSKKDQSYHYNKYAKCLEQNIQLITIFSDEWVLNRNKCKSILLSKLNKFDEKIYAKSCICKEIDNSESRSFCNTYHLQSAPINIIKSFGIFKNDELLGVITLGKHHRKNKQNSIVLNRLCFKEKIQIVGGTSKLFKLCINWAKNENYEKIISWSDNRWSLGKIYENLGFKLEENLNPDYSYVPKNATKRLSKQSQMKSITNCPEGKTENEWAIERGLSRIWDCGKIRWGFNL